MFSVFEIGFKICHRECQIKWEGTETVPDRYDLLFASAVFGLEAGLNAGKTKCKFMSPV